MFALYFSNPGGKREFIATVERLKHAEGLARVLAQNDTRDVVIVENGPMGDTRVHGVYQLGRKIADDVSPAFAAAIADPANTDGNGPQP